MVTVGKHGDVDQSAASTIKCLALATTIIQNQENMSMVLFLTEQYLNATSLIQVKIFITNSSNQNKYFAAPSSSPLLHNTCSVSKY